MEQEEMEAEIIRTIYTPSYSHAENVLILLRTIEARVGTKKAIEIIHRKVCGQENNG